MPIFRPFSIFHGAALAALLTLIALPRPAAGAPAPAETSLVRIAIVGDSTVADYKPDDPHRGWGQLFPEFVDPQRAIVRNFAANGRSTKTFLSEGRWAKTLAFKPDYVFIQFGHNDSHAKGRPESTDADTDYSQYLREYVETARAQGATPILVTPMHRGTWDADGTHLTPELQPYVDAMRRVAAEKKAPLVDLYALSGRAFEQMGPEALITLFALPNKDRTHFNEKGARLLAGMVAHETARLVPGLKPVLRPPSSGAAAALPTWSPGAKVRIVLAGDSTVTDTAGWGTGFEELLKPGVECINLARGGRSSRSFREEGSWAKVLALKPDYVLIQFGHNDQPGHGPARETDPKTTYFQNMTRYVDEARAAGIQPILVTPLTRREFRSDGKIHSSLAPYAEAVRQVASEKKVPLVDLQALSLAYFDKLGPNGWQLLAPPKGSGYDGTHLNHAGSERVGRMVADALRTAVPALAHDLN